MRKARLDTTIRQYENVQRLWREHGFEEDAADAKVVEWNWLSAELAEYFDDNTPFQVFQTACSLWGGLVQTRYPKAGLTVIDEDPKRLDRSASFYARLEAQPSPELSHVPVRRYLGLPEFSPGWFDRQAFDLVRHPAELILCDGPSAATGRWPMILFAREMLEQARMVVFPRLDEEFALLELFSWRELLGGTLHVMPEPGRVGVLLPGIQAAV